MKAKNYFFSLYLIICCCIFHSVTEAVQYVQYEKVYVYKAGSSYYKNVESALNEFNVEFELVDSLSHGADGLYIIFDALNVSQDDLPKNYIIYQTYDLNNTRLAFQMKQLSNDCVKAK